MVWQWLVVGAIVFACLGVVARRAYRFGIGWFRPESPTSDASAACSGCTGCHTRRFAQIGGTNTGSAHELPLVALGPAKPSRPGSDALPTKT